MTNEEAGLYFIDNNEKIISAEKDDNIYNYKALDQEPCEDVISRILKIMWNCRGKHTTSIDKVKMEQIIRDELSSVNPRTDVLDKIEADIEALFEWYPFTKGGAYIRKDDVKKIINKYKTESEVQK